MNYLETIQDSLDYIEDNLKAELTAIDLSRNAGYSLFHFYKLFQNAIGVPVMQFIIRRRLIHAIYEIYHGGKMVNVGLAYGFNTHAGFYKAFKREFGCSPSEFIKLDLALKPYRIQLGKEEYIMLSNKRLTEVLCNWEIESPLNINNFIYKTSGQKSDNTWIVNDKFIFKATTNESKLKNTLNLSKTLYENGLNTPQTLKTMSGENYHTEGELHFQLSPIIKGEVIESNEFLKAGNETYSRYLGEIIGQLHLALSDVDKQIVCNEPNLYDTITNWAIPKVNKVMSINKSIMDDIIASLGNIKGLLPKHVIHRNLNPSNIMYKDMKISGYLDFELSERNYRVLDPVYAATSILSETYVHKDEDYMKKWLSVYNNIIEGYNSVANLTSSEKASLPYIVYSIQLICVAYFSEIDKYTELFEINKNMLTDLLSHHEYLVGEI